MIKLLITFFLSFALYTSLAQNFYVNTKLDVPDYNQTLLLNINDCNFSQSVYTCPIPGNENTGVKYNDMAIDTNNNIYYVATNGKLFRKQPGADTCEYLGSFNNFVTSLVADIDGNIYAAGSNPFTSQLYLYKPQTNQFTIVGNLPPGMYTVGDLFFYEGKLFLLAQTAFGYYCVANVNVSNPLLSCCYITTGTTGNSDRFIGAFTINSGTASRAFIVSENAGDGSRLFELDMLQKTVSPLLCSYPFSVLGAATIYNFSPSVDSQMFCWPLPVELIHFNFTISPAGVKLAWQTASEINNCCFFIQRSFDGVHFQTLDTLAGAVYSDQVQSYSFTDTYFGPVNYYRLVQKDTDGKTKLSRLLLVKTKQEKPVSIYPNPGDNRVHISATEPGGYAVSIADHTGRIVHHYYLRNNESDMDISFLKKGFYIFQLTNAIGEVYNYNFIKK